MNPNATRVLLPVEPNRAYDADGVQTDVTLGDMLSMIEEAIRHYGDEAVVITHDSGNPYGAKFGRLSVYEGITAAADDTDGERW